MQKRSYQKYANGDLDEIASVLDARHAPWYSQAVGPLLLARCGQATNTSFFLSVRNGAFVPFLAPDDIIEFRHQWVAGQLQRSPLGGQCPEHVVDNLVPFVEYERVATEAVMRRSVSLLREALALHPWIRDQAETASMAEEIVTVNNDMLMAVGG
jgi:alpha-galactosidase/6-phospho-beta-glucosidase family protein